MRHGFTLIEVLLAAVILGVGLGAILLSVSQAQKTMLTSTYYETCEEVMDLGDMAYPLEDVKDEDELDVSETKATELWDKISDERLSNEQEEKYHDYTWERECLNKHDNQDDIDRLGGLYLVKVTVRWGRRELHHLLEEAEVRRRAFTMIEMLVAIVLVGVVTTFAVLTFNAVTTAWTSSTEYLDKMQRSDYMLDQVVSGLKSMYYPHAGQQDYTYGFYLTDGGNGDDPRSSDTIEWAKTGSAIVGNQNASADTVHRVQLMVLEEGNHDYKEPIEVTGLYARMCPDPAFRPKRDKKVQEIDYTFANSDMYQPT